MKLKEPAVVYIFDEPLNAPLTIEGSSNRWSSDGAGTSLLGAIWIIVVLVAMFLFFPMIYGSLMESAEQGDPARDPHRTSSPTVQPSSNPDRILPPEEAPAG